MGSIAPIEIFIILGKLGAWLSAHATERLALLLGTSGIVLLSLTRRGLKKQLNLQLSYCQKEH